LSAEGLNIEPRPDLAGADLAPVGALPDDAPEATVLVVEDDPDVRALAVELLTAWGYRVVAAVDAGMALAVLRRDPTIELLFSDIVMPGGVSGGELVGVARAMRPDLKVLLTSGFSQHPVPRSAPPRPTAAFIAKPYRPSELAAKIRRVLGG
jgi:DNA-binding NtrC family response regulator